MSAASASMDVDCVLSPLERLRFCIYRYPYCASVIREVAEQIGLEIDVNNLEESLEKAVEKELKSVENEPRGYREALARRRVEEKLEELIMILTSLMGDELCPVRRRAGRGG